MEQKAQRNLNLKRCLLWLALALILLLTAFSIYGAFIGAQAAQAFFNFVPLAVYWAVFAVLLVAGIASFGRLLHIRGLFLIHLGCILVLMGGMWGSKAGLRTQDALFSTGTIHSGQMVVYEGTAEKTVTTEDDGEKQLPFEIKLVDFRLDFYQPGTLLIQTRDGTGYKTPAEPGSVYMLSDELGSVEIVRKFENFKLVLEGDNRIAIDDPNGEPNPALELRLKAPDGSVTTKYVFERFAGHVRPEDKLAFSYHRMIRDFISDLEVIKDGKVVAGKSIEVNKPLHFGGHFFYQHAYDDKTGTYTVLWVASDSGLITVYLGYIVLCAGVFWHFWLRHIFGDREIED